MNNRWLFRVLGAAFFLVVALLPSTLLALFYETPTVWMATVAGAVVLFLLLWLASGRTRNPGSHVN